MQRWHLPYLGRKAFPSALAPMEVEQYFTVSRQHLTAIRRRRRPLNRLGTALQLGFLRMTGRTLDALQYVPLNVWQYLGTQLDIRAPDIATLQSLYCRRRTLFEHQRLAIALNGFSRLPAAAERNLIAHLRHEATSAFVIDDLVRAGQVWLYEHHYLVLRDRELRHHARAALAFADDVLMQQIRKAVGESVRRSWVPALLKASPRTGQTVFEWLQEPPRERSSTALREALDKRDRLINLGAADLAAVAVPAAKRHAYMKRVIQRKPTTLPRDCRRQNSVEIACFLRHTLLTVTDSCLELTDRVMIDLRRRARDRATAAEPRQLAAYRQCVASAWAIANDRGLAAEDALRRVREALAPVIPTASTTRAAAGRRELARLGCELRSLLGAATALPLQAAAEHPAVIALNLLRRLYQDPSPALPADTEIRFAPCWRSLIARENRKDALAGFEAATLMALQRGLRNGTVHVIDSVRFGDPDSVLIAPNVWSEHRGRYFQHLGLPLAAQTYLARVRTALAASIKELDYEIGQGNITLKDGRVQIPPYRGSPRPEGLTELRRRLFAAVGETHLPDVLLEVDSQTLFSWRLLGRSPRHDQELITVYGAVLAHGSDLTSAEVARMIPGLRVDAIGLVMRRLEDEALLRRANEDVLAFMHRHPIARLWGNGLAASADMMSLDTTRRLWMSRVDPRRQTFAVGTYAHVLNQWGIVYDQPIVLNKCQAGAAIEGALRQRSGPLERVAVDTHGFTHAAMGLAKLVGLDLCPRLADLAERRLYLPRGFAVPPGIEVLADRSVSLRAIQRGWDPLVRIAASVAGGWCPATVALERLGSAAAGELAYEAANALGKLQRTVFLCDYWANSAFREDILNLLNQGESVHSLQRVIHHGLITAKRGRAPEELMAISGSLTLLTNIVMAFSTSRMQRVVNENPADYPHRDLAHIAPIAHRHINLRGTFSFNVDRHRDRLFEAPSGRRSVDAN
jgi:TnpA family transposase